MQAAAAVPPYVADCYLCPGQRAGERRAKPAVYGHLRVRQRPSVGRAARPAGGGAGRGHLPQPPCSPASRGWSATARGTISRWRSWSRAEVDRLLEVWQEQYRDLGGRDGIDHVLVFENKGEVVGVSNPHPHCQIYATNFVFKTIETEARRGRAAPGRAPAACCSRTSSPPSRPTAAASSRRTTRRSPSCRTSRVTPTRSSWRRRRRTRASRHSSAAERRDLAAVSTGGARPLRQPVADAVSLRHAAAPGARPTVASIRASTSTSSSTRRCASPTC